MRTQKIFPNVQAILIRALTLKVFLNLQTILIRTLTQKFFLNVRVIIFVDAARLKRNKFHLYFYVRRLTLQ